MRKIKYKLYFAKLGVLTGASRIKDKMEKALKEFRLVNDDITLGIIGHEEHWADSSGNIRIWHSKTSNYAGGKGPLYDILMHPQCFVFCKQKDQFIGRLDQDNKKIYENDILEIEGLHCVNYGKEDEHYETIRGIVCFRYGTYQLKYLSQDHAEDAKYKPEFVKLWDDGENEWYNLCNLETEQTGRVIGNIYDNPELTGEDRSYKDIALHI